MKSIIFGLIYLSVFAAVFFLLSLFGILWMPSYLVVISNPGWFMTYSIFLGWWVSLFPAMEYAEHVNL